jgi:polysaccharide pyruvyl transferase WcaK-like protein
MEIALCGFYGKSNFGDDLMADCLPEVLSLGGRHNVTVFSDCESHGVKSAKNELNYFNYDVVVIGGGGIINPKFWAFKKAELEKLIQSQAPIFFLNVNVTEDFNLEQGFPEQIARLNARWWVRDDFSHTILAKHGIQSKVLPDISFRITNHSMPKDQKKLLFFPNAYLLNKLFCKNNTLDYIKAHESAFTIANFLDWMAHFGWKIEFIPSQTGKDFDDRIVGGLIYSLMQRKDVAFWQSNSLPWVNIIHKICESDLVISMRYHASTVSIASGVSLIDITHHAKNKNLMRDLNLESVSVDYDALSHNALVSAANNSHMIKSSEINLFNQMAKKSWDEFIVEWSLIMANLEKR